MTSAPVLRPTLWRTCRVLANRTRLRILARLFQQPGQTVSAVAKHLKRPLPVTSQYLRALEARGLLTARRVGRWVEYGPAQAATTAIATELVRALRLTFRRGPKPVETVFRLATAFTHPRRIDIFRALGTGPATMRQVKDATRISVRALVRHLRKLVARGFVTCRRGRYAVADRPDVFGRELARLASQPAAGMPAAIAGIRPPLSAPRTAATLSVSTARTRN